MGFKLMYTIGNISQLMNIKNERNDISKKAYEISKERAYRMSKEKAYNILAFMGCKPMTSVTIYFPVYEISNKKALKIQALMGFKPMTKYFPACELLTKAYKNMRVLVYQRRKLTNI